MHLIEKTCPKCGANLEFSSTDREVKCKYCQKEFAIEHNTKDTIENVINNFDSYELVSKVGNVIGKVTIISLIISGIVTVLVALAFIFIGYKVYTTFNNPITHQKTNLINKNKSNNLEKLDQITETEQKELSERSVKIINDRLGILEKPVPTEYKHLGYYLAKKDTTSTLYDIYQLKFDTHLNYTAVKYDNATYKSKLKVGNGAIMQVTSYRDRTIGIGSERLEAVYDKIEFANSLDEITATDGLYVE